MILNTSYKGLNPKDSFSFSFCYVTMDNILENEE